MKIPVSLRDADSRRVGGCSKPGCKVRGTLQRHHVRHEAMWLGIWSGRRKGEERWEKFKERYHAFHPDDYVVVCPNHHAEIHRIYDNVIIADKKITRRNLAHYSWKQADALMDKLETVCEDWLKLKSPGINSKSYRSSIWRRRLP